MKIRKFIWNAIGILCAIVCLAVIVYPLWLYAMDEPLYSWSSDAHVSPKK